MNYKNILGILLVLTLSLFISGCGEDEDSSTTSPFLGGTKGIVADFEEIGLVSDTSNMNEVYSGEDFAVEVTLKNKGEEEVEQGEALVKIQGIDTNQFGIPAESSNPDEIEPITEYVKDGGVSTVDFGDASYNVTGSFYDANIFAVYSYPYQTNVAVPNVCYKGDVREDRVCNIDESKKVYSSGAPIVVTKAVESPAATRKLRLMLTGSNVCGGRASLHREFDSRYDEIGFEVMTEGWTCKSKNESVARLSEGSTQIRCTLDEELDENDLYESQFDIRLNYYYEDIVKTTVRVLEESA